MSLKRIFGVKKSRKYPLQFDSRGQSLRARCSALFDEGMRPTEVVKELGMKRSTADTYFKQWKWLGPDFEQSMPTLKSFSGRLLQTEIITWICLPRDSGWQMMNLRPFSPSPMGCVGY